LGTTGGIAIGGGVGPFGTRCGGEDVSSNAAARAALARCAIIASLDSVVRSLATGDEFEENSSSIEEPAEIVMTPPHTEQRARTVLDGTFAGSTRKTDRHSGQETFTFPPSRPTYPGAPSPADSRQAWRPVAGRSRTPSQEESSRSSS